MAGTAARPTPRNGAAAPTRKARAPGGARAAAKPTVLGRVFARPGVIVAGATFAAVMTGIVANALLFQKGHHPSPLFAAAPAETAPAVPASLLAPPTVLPTPAQRQAAPEPVSAAPAAEAPAPAPAAKEAAPAAVRKLPAKPAHAAATPAGKPAHKPAPAPHRDLIGDLLGRQGN